MYAVLKKEFWGRFDAINDVNNIVSNQSGMSRLPETWIMPDTLYRVILLHLFCFGFFFAF